MGLNNSYRFENFTTATSHVSVWMSISTQTSNEQGFTIINQGKLNDMTTNIMQEFILTETSTTPATSYSGILFQTGDSISINNLNPFWIWTRTTSTDASVEYVENAMGGY